MHHDHTNLNEDLYVRGACIYIYMVPRAFCPTTACAFHMCYVFQHDTQVARFISDKHCLQQMINSFRHLSILISFHFYVYLGHQYAITKEIKTAIKRNQKTFERNSIGAKEVQKEVNRSQEECWRNQYGSIIFKHKNRGISAKPVNYLQNI